MVQLTAQILTICDFALTSQEGKLSLIGIFDRIFVNDTPTRYARFFLVAVLQGQPNTDYPVTLSIASANGEMALPEKELTIKFGTNGKANLISDIVNLNLNHLGEYVASVKSHKKTIATTSFFVTKVNQNGTASTPLPN